MIIILQKKNGKTNSELSEYIQSLTDGKYLVRIHSLENNNLEALRKKYFFQIETIANHTGHTKQETHELFKKSIDIISTKGNNLSVEQWLKLIEQLQEYAFFNLDILL